MIHGTTKLKELCAKFRNDLLKPRETFRQENQIFDEPDHSNIFNKAKQFDSNKNDNKTKNDDNDSTESSEEEGEATAASLASDNLLTLEIERKQQVPNRLHPELWFNEYKQVKQRLER